MRISRGRALLRALLDTDPGEAWGDTRVWCSGCGARRLQMRRDENAVLFRCVGCSPASASYDLRNPSFARLVGDLVRPAAILNRAAAWSSEYFSRGAGEADCTRCGRSIRVRHHREGRRRGLHGACRACGEQVWSSVLGLAHSQPEARAFRAEHTRVRTLPERDLAYGQRGGDARPARGRAGKRRTRCPVRAGHPARARDALTSSTGAVRSPSSRLCAALDGWSRLRRRGLGAERGAPVLCLRRDGIDGRDRRDDRRSACALGLARLGGRGLRRPLEPQARACLGESPTGRDRRAALARAGGGMAVGRVRRRGGAVGRFVLLLTGRERAAAQPRRPGGAAGSQLAEHLEQPDRAARRRPARRRAPHLLGSRGGRRRGRAELRRGGGAHRTDLRSAGSACPRAGVVRLGVLLAGVARRAPPRRQRPHDRAPFPRVRPDDVRRHDARPTDRRLGPRRTRRRTPGICLDPD